MSRMRSGGPMGGMNNIIEKPKNFKKSIMQLVKFCKPYFPVILIAIVLAVAGTVLTIIGPNEIRKITNLITDGIVSGININAVVSVGLFLVVLYGLSAIFSYAQSFIMTTITQKISKNLRTNISVKINKLPLKYFDSTSYGDTLSRVTNDVDAIGNTLNHSIVSLVTSIVMLVGSIIMMIVTNPIMAATTVFASIFGFAIMAIIMVKSQKYFIQQQQTLGDLNGHIEEIYTGHNVVKVYNGEADAKIKFAKMNDSLCGNAWKAQFFSGLMMPIMNFIGNFGYVAVCVVGAILVMTQGLDFGVITAFMLYVKLFTQPLTQLAQVATSLQSTAAASGRVFEFLGETELIDESDKTFKLQNIKGDIEFKNVKFGYDKDRTIVNNFSAHALPGQKIAIVGPTGAGKTTMVNLLMHFYEVDEGEILIDGVSTSSLTRENVHELFGMVLQDTWTFEGSVRDNIVYSKPNVTNEQVIEVCKTVGLHHFIMTLPHGYDEIIDDNANLSQGQKQLLTIARSMIKNAPMLILDEATSSVDTRTETLIQSAMDKLMQGRTTFVIAHRLSTIKNADLILVMKDGDIIEQGNHSELISQNGFYAQLYNSQFDTAS